MMAGQWNPVEALLMNADEIHDENMKEFADAIAVKQRNRHTPGPWELNSVFGPSTGALSVKHPTWESNSHPIARVYRRLMDDRREDGTHQFDDAEAQANANMIAAAPDLYDACKMLLVAYEGGEPGDSIDWEDLDDVVEAAREAVLKAECRADA